MVHIYISFTGKFVHSVKGKGWMWSIVISASCEYQFIVVHENLVQHPRKDRFRLLAKVNIVKGLFLWGLQAADAQLPRLGQAVYFTKWNYYLETQWHTTRTIRKPHKVQQLSKALYEYSPNFQSSDLGI